MDQTSFFDLAYDNKKKKTRKEKFLGEMDKVLPWEKLLRPITKQYPKSKRGRPVIPCGVMLRIYFMQNWYSLSDPSMEDSLYDIESMRRFAGVDINNIPDETTICKFRHFLEKHHLTDKLFTIIRKYLKSHNLLLSEGTIVDATIVHAPSSTKNKNKQRDPDMKQTKKGNQWYFGMKAHIGTDTEGRVHSVSVTDASVHDSVIMKELVYGEEDVLYGDKGYVNQESKQEYESQGVAWRINRKAKRGRKLTCADKSFNRKSNKVRSRVEHVFGIIKNLWGYRKVRYKGLYKNASQVFTLMGLANLYMVRKKLVKT